MPKKHLVLKTEQRAGLVTHITWCGRNEANGTMTVLTDDPEDLDLCLQCKRRRSRQLALPVGVLQLSDAGKNLAWNRASKQLRNLHQDEYRQLLHEFGTQEYVITSVMPAVAVARPASARALRALCDQYPEEFEQCKAQQRENLLREPQAEIKGYAIRVKDLSK